MKDEEDEHWRAVCGGVCAEGGGGGGVKVVEGGERWGGSLTEPFVVPLCCTIISITELMYHLLYQFTNYRLPTDVSFSVLLYHLLCLRTMVPMCYLL